MITDSKDEKEKVWLEKRERHKIILSTLEKKEIDLKKSIEELEKKIRLTAKKFEEKIKTKQHVIAQLEKKRDELELKLREMENKPMPEEEGTEQTDENKDDFYVHTQFNPVQ